MSDMQETFLSREDKFTGRVVSVHVDQVLLPNGHQSFREVVDHNGGVAILALDDDNNVLTVTQYRYVFGREMLEIPAGKLETNEDPASAALRELTGKTAIPEFQRWLEKMGFVENGRLTAKAGDGSSLLF